MGKHLLGMRRSGRGGGTSRVGGLAAGKTGGIAPDIHLKRPHLPDSNQHAIRDSRSTGRVSGQQEEDLEDAPGGRHALFRAAPGWLLLDALLTFEGAERVGCLRLGQSDV
jgi:hypothetical protein